MTGAGQTGAAAFQGTFEVSEEANCRDERRSDAACSGAADIISDAETVGLIEEFASGIHDFLDGQAAMKFSFVSKRFCKIIMSSYLDRDVAWSFDEGLFAQALMTVRAAGVSHNV